MSRRTLRQHAGLTQSELGKELNVDHAAVSNWERGVNKPLRKYHRLLATALHVTEEQLRKELE